LLFISFVRFIRFIAPEDSSHGAADLCELLRRGVLGRVEVQLDARREGQACPELGGQALGPSRSRKRRDDAFGRRGIRHGRFNLLAGEDPPDRVEGMSRRLELLDTSNRVQVTLVVMPPAT
jgi:hypothetical protein